MFALAGAAELRATVIYDITIQCTQTTIITQNHVWHAGPVLCGLMPSLWLSASVLNLPASQLSMTIHYTSIVLATPTWSPLSFSPSAIILR